MVQGGGTLSPSYFETSTSDVVVARAGTSVAICSHMATTIICCMIYKSLGRSSLEEVSEDVLWHGCSVNSSGGQQAWEILGLLSYWRGLGCPWYNLQNLGTTSYLHGLFLVQCLARCFHCYSHLNYVFLHTTPLDDCKKCMGRIDINCYSKSGPK
ncbi:UNVERIFIED_CONTAM: hypothetical protein Sangu_1665300 [Sesamum angustifolium]|uniref:Uncharacterized protein n=1 Tax=Sesamum angustifolium TaxID=2727405 RepID=A0AAW2MJZ2_9LAMI